MKHRVRVVTFLCVVIGLGSAGCSALPGLVATPTPTPTFTPTPTSTPTATPTPPPTPTATVTPTPSQTGVQAIKQTDGSTLVNDYVNKYQLVFGSDWLVVPVVDTTTPLTNFTLDIITYGLDVGELNTLLNGLDLKKTPVTAFTMDRKYDANGLQPYIIVQVFDDESTVSLPINTLVAGDEQDLKQQYHAKILKSSRAASPNPNGVEFGTLDALVSKSSNVQLVFAFVLFKSNGKLILISLTTDKQSWDQLSPAIDMIIRTLKLLGP